MKCKTDIEFKKEVFELVGNEYTFLEEYKNNKYKIMVKHNTCNKVYYVSPHMFLRGRRCPYCFGTFRKTTEQFKKEVFELVGNEYEVLGEYINTSTKIKMKHNKNENHIFEISPNDFLSNNIRCPYCFGTFRKTTEQFKKEVFELVGNEYEVLGEYISNKNKLKFIHKKCNNIFDMRPNDFQQGQRCPYCSNKSLMEEKIADYLNNKNIKFNRQVKFDDCKYKRALRFDFEIFIENYNKIILLEYDGEFHYKKQYYEKSFKEQLIRDQIKNEYCKNNNIELYRISYKDKNNICSILDNIISNYIK